MRVMLGAIALATAAATSTAQVVPMSFSDMVKKSDQILVGTAVKAASRYDGGRKTIRTYVTFTDLVVQKGKPAKTLTLRFEGGKIGDDQLRVSGMPRIKLGQRYLLYVRGNGKHLSPITGYNQGIFSITKEGGRDVLRNATGLPLIGVRDDRLVFADRPTPPSRGPKLVPVKGFVPVPANKDASKLEEEALRQRMNRRSSAKGAEQLPPPRGAKEVTGGVSPPPADTKVAPPAKKDVSPVFVAPAKDTGARASVNEMLTRSKRVR